MPGVIIFARRLFVSIQTSERKILLFSELVWWLFQMLFQVGGFDRYSDWSSYIRNLQRGFWRSCTHLKPQ